MTVKRLLAVGLVMVGSLPLACGGDDSGSDEETPEGPDISEVPELFAAAYCDALSECMPPELVAQFLGTQNCDAFALKTYDNGLFEAVEVAIENGTIKYNGARVDACLDEIRRSGCVSNVYFPACKEALSGTVAADGECSQDAECMGDRVCLVDGLCPGTCSARLEDGERCAREADCREGSTCLDAICTPLRLPGEECEEDGVGCTGGYLCLGADADEGQTGTCRSMNEIFTAAEGDPCDPANELCEPGAFCAVALEGETVTWTCLPQAPSGGDCNVAFPDMCPPGEYCSGVNADVRVFEGICSQLPADGNDCSLGRCAAEHVCVDGICQKLKPNGEGCTEHNECYSGKCEPGTCAPNTPCAP